MGKAHEMEMESSESLSRMNFFPFMEAQWYQRRKEGGICVCVFGGRMLNGTGRELTFLKAWPGGAVLYVLLYLTHPSTLETSIIYLSLIHCTHMAKLRLMGIKGLPKGTQVVDLGSGWEYGFPGPSHEPSIGVGNLLKK